jgi:hypothetical protein
VKENGKRVADPCRQCDRQLGKCVDKVSCC